MKRTRIADTDRLLAQPAYALSRLHHSLIAQLEAGLAGAGLSLRTHQALACLADHGADSQQEVSKSLAVDRSEMVRIIDRLEEVGMVVRQPDPDDRRRHRLSLTAAGRNALDEGDRIIESVTEEALAGLTAAERRTLHALTVRALRPAR